MDVNQISMPMRILLIGAVVFLAAWFTILKPGGGEEDIPAVAPANTTETTTGTASASAAPDAASEGEDTTVAATAIPNDVLAKLPKDVTKAIKARKTLVLGVFTDDAKSYRPMADDDRYVRNALKKTNRYKGEVFAKNISIADLATYAPLVNDLDIDQSPTVVVIDRNLKGTTLTGYVDRVSINQAIQDARRDSIDPYVTDEFVRAANDICADSDLHTHRWSLPTIPGTKARAKATLRLNALIRAELAAVTKLETPAKHKALTADWKQVLRNAIAFNKRTVELLRTKGQTAAAKHSASSDDTLNRKLDRRFNTVGVTSCAFNRQS